MEQSGKAICYQSIARYLPDPHPPEDASVQCRTEFNLIQLLRIPTLVGGKVFLMPARRFNAIKASKCYFLKLKLGP